MALTPDDPHRGWTIWHWLFGSGGLVTMIWAFFFTGLKDWLKNAFWDRIFKKRAEERAQHLQDCVKIAEFKALETTVAALSSTTAAQMQQLAAVTHAAAIDLTDKATKLENNMEKLDESVGQNLSAMHEKVNNNNVIVAKLSQKVEDLPDVIIGKLAVRMNLQGPAILPVQQKQTGTGG